MGICPAAKRKISSRNAFAQPSLESDTIITVSVSKNSSLIIENSYINNNTSGNQGGGVYIQDGSDSRIINSYIENNTCPGYGGGLTFYRGNLELIGTVVRSNESTNDYGGGI